MVEHQYSKNPNLIYAIIRSRKRIQALRDLTLESGQEELDRQARLKKEQAANPEVQRDASMDSLRSPTVSRTPTLSDVPEENAAFAIGDDDSDNENSDHDPETPENDNPKCPENRELPPLQTQGHGPGGGSRSFSATSATSASVTSPIDESVPMQMRGMSEKARGKMPVGTPVFSRTNSIASLSGSVLGVPSGEGFQASGEWVCYFLLFYFFSYIGLIGLIGMAD